jgi:hypothetical protein
VNASTPSSDFVFVDDRCIGNDTHLNDIMLALIIIIIVVKSEIVIEIDIDIENSLPFHVCKPPPPYTHKI